MSDLHFKFWPKGLPHTLTAPKTNLYYNAEVAAARYPDKPFIVFFDSTVTYGEFKRETEQLAGFLQRECGVKKGDRVLLVMQNSPQFMISYYGILRADAVVVPVNPMSVTAELEHYVHDSGAKVAVVAQEVFAQSRPLIGKGLDRIVVAAYADYVKRPTDLRVPDVVSAPRQDIKEAGVTMWVDALARNLTPGPLTAGAEDLCVIPYSSGTTGRPKGCMLTHANVMHTTLVNTAWFHNTPDSTQLVVLPFFHVTSMQGGMNGPLYACNTIVLMCRWDRDLAAELIQRYKVLGWTAISTMVIDFLANPRLSDYDLSSIQRISGGGAAMPAAVAQRVIELVGSPYVEGYGLTETIAPTHINPIDRPKKQCLGVPVFSTESLVIDPDTLKELPQGQTGEIVSHGPQIFRGYWRNEEATRAAFIEIGGKQFFRTGDLGYVDEEGYFFLVDRLKRMINASGFKVWPAEVETIMYQHPAVQEACIVAAKDSHRGETVKCFIVLRTAFVGKVTAEEIVEWARQKMATYKAPRIVEFVETLPKSATGKVQWRLLQEQELAKAS